MTTDLREFGYATGVNVLMAYRGDADVEIPYRLIRRIEISAYIPQNRRAPASVTLRSGKTIAIELDNIEEGRLLRGSAEFGEFRIRRRQGAPPRALRSLDDRAVAVGIASRASRAPGAEASASGRLGSPARARVSSRGWPTTVLATSSPSTRSDCPTT